MRLLAEEVECSRGVQEGVGVGRRGDAGGGGSDPSAASTSGIHLLVLFLNLIHWARRLLERFWRA